MEGLRQGVYPGAVLLVGKGDEIVFFQAVGHRALIPRERPMEDETIFDLASLTKPLATALAILKMVDQGIIALDEPLHDLLPLPVPEGKQGITPRLLLSHSGGFKDWEPFYLDLVHVEAEKRKVQLRHRLLHMPLAYKPGQKTVYSDLGFMLLEWVIEERSGSSLPQFMARHIFGALSLRRTLFVDEGGSMSLGSDQFAATEDCPWRKRVVAGFVHDENAYALGGYSGHAGLFGSAREVYSVAHLLLSHFRGERDDFFRPETVREFLRRHEPAAGGTWALGWDTPSSKGSSSGVYFSPDSVGHLGFTGTSVWVDLAKGVIVVLLTNRIHPSRKNQKIREFRPKMHNLVMEALGEG